MTAIKNKRLSNKVNAAFAIIGIKQTIDPFAVSFFDVEISFGNETLKIDLMLMDVYMHRYVTPIKIYRGRVMLVYPTPALKLPNGIFACR